MVLVRVRQPAGHAVWQPSTKSSVLGALHPHGSTRFSWTEHPGMGQRSGSQSDGRVVCVTVGQGVVVGGRGGSVIIVVVTTAVELVDVVVVVGVGRVRVRVVRLLLVHVSLVDRNTTRHPSYGQSASHGARSVAVGMADGHPHGFNTVVTTRQSLSQTCEHVGLMIDCVSVGQATSAAVLGPGIVAAAVGAGAASSAATRWLLWSFDQPFSLSRPPWFRFVLVGG
jgi:hypothetical protein